MSDTVIIKDGTATPVYMSGGSGAVGANAAAASAALAEADRLAAAASATAADNSADLAAQSAAAAAESEDNAAAHESAAEAHKNTAQTAAAGAGASEAAVLAAIAGEDITAQLPLQAASVAALQAIDPGTLTAGRQAMLSAARLEGLFVWRTGDQSANIIADPHKGLWVPPASDADGSSGAWERVMVGNSFHAEWWLPDAMPADAETYLNAMTDLLPAGAEVILPKRQTTISAAGPWIILTEGLVVRGFGRESPLWGAGVAQQLVFIAADDVLLDNVYGGNTAGAMTDVDSPVFHVADARALTAGAVPFQNIRNVRFRDCGAINAETGIRIGYSTDTVNNVVYESHDCEVEGFYAEGITKYAIEAFNSRRPRIHDNVIKLGGAGGYAMRINACEDYLIRGNVMVGFNETSSGGIKIDIADSKPNTYLAGRNGVVADNQFDNFVTDITLLSHEGALLIEGNVATGRTDGATTFLSVSATGIIHTRQAEVEQLTVRGNVVHNRSLFVIGQGVIRHARIDGNEFISNAHTDARFALADGVSGEAMNVEIVRNRALLKTNNGSTGSLLRTQGTHDAGSIFRMDDNEVTPDYTGALFGVPNSTTTFLMRDPVSNRELNGPTAAAWVTATAYSAGDKRSIGAGITFTALAGHTSGSFFSDLDSGLWANTAWLDERPALNEAEYD